MKIESVLTVKIFESIRLLSAIGVGGPTGSKEAAKRRTEAIRTVGPTLIKIRLQVILRV